MHYLKLFYDWTEAWAPLIAIIAWIVAKPELQRKMVPVIVYFLCAVVLNVCIDYSWKYKEDVPIWMAEDNTVLYNTQSILRCIVFLVFFQLNLKSWYARMNLILGGIYLVFVGVNFLFFENIMNFSSISTTAESIMLISSCLLYFFMVLSDDEMVHVVKLPGFWFTIGVLLYTTANFAVFLMFTSLVKIDGDFATNLWHVHNAFYFVLCCCTAKAYHTYG